LEEYIRHEIAIKGSSRKTANTYYVNLRQFMRYLKMTVYDIPREEYTTIKIFDISEKELLTVSYDTILKYLYFLSEEGLVPSTRSNKLSAISTFYDYLCDSHPDVFKYNPAQRVDKPKLPKRQPKYLTESESKMLLKASMKTSEPERDYCIISLFLNCGMRLSELVNINISDIGTDTIQIMGKGNKQRTIYLNSSCISAIDNWLLRRSKIENIIDSKALFVSRRRTRITQRAVEKIVEKTLQAAGLGGRGFSTHKLRHTAATLLHEKGADLLELKEILGHEHTTTTEIYTHINNQRLREIAKTSPFAEFDSASINKEEESATTVVAPKGSVSDES